MIDKRYRAQADLLLQALPSIAKENIFALKGGTAINLFLRDMPRLSVDIDLTYIPIEDRTTSLKNISEGLTRIKAELKKTIQGISIADDPGNGEEVKIFIQKNNAQVKIEVNTVTRGIIN